MSALAERELTEDALTRALVEARKVHGHVEFALIVGGRAKLRADRIVGAWESPLYAAVSIVRDPKADPDHWSLAPIQKRRPYRRRG